MPVPREPMYRGEDEGRQGGRGCLTGLALIILGVAVLVVLVTHL